MNKICHFNPVGTKLTELTVGTKFPRSLQQIDTLQFKISIRQRANTEVCETLFHVTNIEIVAPGAMKGWNERELRNFTVSFLQEIYLFSTRKIFIFYKKNIYFLQEKYLFSTRNIFIFYKNFFYFLQEKYLYSIRNIFMFYKKYF